MREKRRTLSLYHGTGIAGGKKSEPEPELECEDDAEALLETFMNEECDDDEDDRAPACRKRKHA